MGEKIIDLDGTIDPADFYGAADVNFHRLVGKFPELKIVARGGTLKLLGSEEQIVRFEERVAQLVAYFRRYGHLSPEVLDQIFDVPTVDRRPVAGEGDTAAGTEDVIVYGNNGNIVRARTTNQRKLVELYAKNDLLFAVGPAGSGKTYTAIALAVRALKNKEVRRIILTRPAVEAGEKLGFLPGDLQEKVNPYLRPIYDALDDTLGAETAAKYMERGLIEVVPLAYMRGRTLDASFIILDEAQNTTPPQMKMFLTRLGQGSKAVVTGDITQIDLPAGQKSGLHDAQQVLHGVPGLAFCYLTDLDVVRHPLVQKIIEAYARAEG